MFTFTILAACWLSLVFTEEQHTALSVSSENIAAFFLMRSKCKEKKYLCPQLFGERFVNHYRSQDFHFLNVIRADVKQIQETQTSLV